MVSVAALANPKEAAVPDKDPYVLAPFVITPDVIDLDQIVAKKDTGYDGPFADQDAIGIDTSVVMGKPGFFGGDVPDFVPFDGPLTLPALRVAHADGSGRPDVVFHAGDVVRVTVVNGHFAPAPGAREPQVAVTGPTGSIPVGAVATGATYVDVTVPAGTAPGAYAVTAHAAFGTTVLPAEVAVPVAASFTVVDVNVPVVVVLRDASPVTGPGDSVTRRLAVVLGPLLASDVQIDPASLRVEARALPGHPAPTGTFTVAVAPGTAPAAELDVTFRFPGAATGVALTVRGVAVVRGVRHEFVAAPPLLVQRLTVTNLAQRVAAQFLATLRIALPFEPAGGNVRAYVPGIPLVPVLAGGTDRGTAVGTVPDAITSTVNSIPLPGAAAPGDVLDVDLAVEWEPGGVPFALTRSPLDTSSDPLALNRLDVAIVPVPTGASWFDPLRGAPDRGALPHLSLTAVVTPTVSAPSLGMPPTTLDPIRLSLPNPIAVGLPVPELVALYRAPDMAAGWSGAATPSHGDGAVAIITRVANGPVAFDDRTHAIAPVGEADRLPEDVRRVVSLAPAGGLASLGRLGEVLELLRAPQSIAVPGGVPLDAGLRTVTRLAAPPGSPLAAALAPLLGLVAAVDVLAGSLAQLVAQTVQKDPQRPDAYIRLLPGAGAIPMNLDTPFIRHSSIWTGSDVHIEDETESLVLLGGPASAVTLFCDRGLSGRHGAATFATAGGFCCLEPRFDRVGGGFSGPGVYPLRAPGVPAPATAPEGAAFGTVTATGAVDPTSGIRLGGPGEAFDQTLARSVSSLVFA